MTNRWYITLYTKNGNRYTFDGAEECASYEQAQRRLRTYKPPYPSQLYKVEYEEIVGQLATVPKPTISPRKQYAHNKVKRAFQEDADKMKDDIVASIEALRPNSSIEDIKSILDDINFYKSVWTKEQFNDFIVALEAQPCCTALTYKYNANHHIGKYIYISDRG